MAETETNPEQPAETPPAEVREEHHTESQHRAEANRFERLKTWYLDRKKWTIPSSVLLLILILAGVPFTRYNIAGLALKKDFSIKVVDSTADTPVSGATVSLGTVSAETDGTGKAVLHHVKPGPHKLQLSKKYYKAANPTVSVSLFTQKTVPTVQMTATGRQVKISVVNLITKKPLSGVDIKVADISAKTDKDGSATVVLPAGAGQQAATLSLDNYNDAKVTVKVSNDKIQENDFNLTPSGKVYFLSKLSGKIDVVKTNLDGSDRQTVLAGTGSEDDSNTVLLASRDWKYLALLSRRAGSAPSLYLIDTSDDSLKTIDEGNVSFGLNGWSDDDFVYTITRNDVQVWQPNRQALKSYDAPSKKLTILDQTAGQGTDQYNHADETFGSVYLIGKNIVYDKSWDNYYAFVSSPDPVTGKLKSGIYGVNTSGGNKLTFKTFDNTLGWYLGIDSILNKPNEIYYQVTDPYQISLHGGGPTYYEYDNGKLTVKTDITDSYNNYDRSKTYLLSPDDNSTFWFEPRDGKNTLFTGDESGGTSKQIASLSEYKPYGWYTDDYLLVSKGDSELYIMPKDGSQSPIKISDYHKPAVNFYGYGGGYGGI